MTSSKLVHALIGKSIAETLLVGALAVVAFLNVLPPFFQGWSELTDYGIAGWAIDYRSPYERVEVQLFIDEKFFATAVADRSRPDLSSAGWAPDEWHGYTFVITSLPEGAHEARVYALRNSSNDARKSLQLMGAPIPFTVTGDRKLQKVMVSK